MPDCVRGSTAERLDREDRKRTIICEQLCHIAEHNALMLERELAVEIVGRPGEETRGVRSGKEHNAKFACLRPAILSYALDYTDTEDSVKTCRDMHRATLRDGHETAPAKNHMQSPIQHPEIISTDTLRISNKPST